MLALEFLQGNVAGWKTVSYGDLALRETSFEAVVLLWVMAYGLCTPVLSLWTGALKLVTEDLCII